MYQVHCMRVPVGLREGKKTPMNKIVNEIHFMKGNKGKWLNFSREQGNKEKTLKEKG